jgi:hypothetical protein
MPCDYAAEKPDVSWSELTFEPCPQRTLAQMSNSKAPLIQKVARGPLIPAFALQVKQAEANAGIGPLAKRECAMYICGDLIER